MLAARSGWSATFFIRTVGRERLLFFQPVHQVQHVAGKQAALFMREPRKMSRFKGFLP